MVVVVNPETKCDIIQASTPRFGSSVAKFIHGLRRWKMPNATFLEAGILLKLKLCITIIRISL